MQEVICFTKLGQSCITQIMELISFSMLSLVKDSKVIKRKEMKDGDQLYWWKTQILSVPSIEVENQKAV